MKLDVEKYQNTICYGAAVVAALAGFEYPSLADPGAWLILNVLQSIVLFIVVLISSRGLVSQSLQKNGQYAAWKVFAIVLLATLYWIPLGLDLTDEGRRQAFSWFICLNGELQGVDSKFGSHMVNALWLKLWGNPSVLWSRIGYALLTASTATLVYKALKASVSTYSALVSTLAVSALLLYFSTRSIDYNNLPLFTVLLAFYLLEYNARKHWTYSVLGGMLLSYAVLARFPYLPYLLLPLVLHLTHRFSNEKQPINSLIGAYTGILIGIVAIVIGLQSVDALPDYLSHLRSSYLEGFLKNEAPTTLSFHKHDRQSLFALYSEQSTRLLQFFWPTIIGSGLLMIATKKLKFWNLALAVVFFGGAQAMILPGGSFEYLLLAVVVGQIFYALWYAFTSPSKALMGILVFGLMLSAMSFLGSNNGIRNIVFSGGFIVISGLALAVFVESWRHDKRNWQYVLVMSLVAILSISAWILRGSNIYRDLPKSQLSATFYNRQLWGIFTNPTAQKATAGLLDFSDQRLTQVATIKAVNTVPSVYYLLDKPWRKSPYWNLRNLRVEEREAFFESDDSPDGIVVSLDNPRADNWPVSGTPSIERDQPYLEFYLEYLPQSDYQKVYENQGFSVWLKAGL